MMGMTTIIVPTTSKPDPVRFIWPPGCQHVYTRAGLGVGRPISTVISKRWATREEVFPRCSFEPVSEWVNSLRTEQIAVRDVSIAKTLSTSGSRAITAIGHRQKVQFTHGSVLGVTEI